MYMMQQGKITELEIMVQIRVSIFAHNGRFVPLCSMVLIPK